MGLIATYAVLFAVLHSLARTWGITIYSLWYPIAGVRFAFLWRYGAKFAWPFALAEPEPFTLANLTTKSFVAVSGFDMSAD